MNIQQNDTGSGKLLVLVWFNEVIFKSIIVGSSPDGVKPKTIKFVLVASPLIIYKHSALRRNQRLVG
jgi:hypothetical protein